MINNVSKLTQMDREAQRIYKNEVAGRLNVSVKDVETLIEKGYDIGGLLEDGFKFDDEIVGDLDSQLRDFAEAKMCEANDW